MSSELSTKHDLMAAENTTAEAIYAAVRILRVIQYRKSYIAVALVVSSLLGIVYFLTTKPVYESTASLLITQSSDIWNASTTQDSTQQSLIPTYQQLFHSSIVLSGAVQKLMDMPAFAHVDFESVPAERWADVLSNKLTAKAARQTNIIELVYRSSNPATAKAVLSVVVASYLDFIEKNHKDNSVQIVQILEREREDIQDKLEQKTAKLLDMKRSVREFGLREDSTTLHPAVQRVVRINETLLEVQKDRLQVQSTLSSVRDAVRQGRDLRQHLSRMEPVLGDQLLANTLGMSPHSIQLRNDIDQKLIEDRAQLAAWRYHLGPTHPDIVQLEDRIGRAEQYRKDYQEKSNQHLEELQSGRLGPILVSMLEEKLIDARRHEESLLQQYAEFEAEAVKLNDRLFALTMVERDVERLNKHHDALLDNITNLDISQNRSDLRVAVVSEPKATNAPVSPQLAFVCLMSILGGLGAGVILVYVMDILDDRFRSPDEMTDQMGVPLLAVVRDMAINEAGGIDAIPTYVSPDDVVSEAFRTIRTALAFSDEDTTCLAITSSQPGDGKTTIISNLAATFAIAGKRTLLIDADLRRPGLTRLLDKRGLGGLSVVLRSTDDVTQSCQDQVLLTGIDGLDLLACGPRTPDPAELLGSSRMADVIGWAESVYDQVLIDCPPIMAATDTAIVGRITNGVILVVQPEKNHRRLVLRATESIRSLNVKLIGVVANRITNSSAAGYYGHEYGYTYGYGYDDGTADEHTTHSSEKISRESDPALHDESAGSEGAGQEDAATLPIKPRRVA